MSEPIETCFVCGDPTGRAGAGEDSIYIGDIGPFDEKCYDILSAHFYAELQAKYLAAVGIKRLGYEAYYDRAKTLEERLKIAEGLAVFNMLESAISEVTG